MAFALHCFAAAAAVATVPLPAQWFDQTVDHFAPATDPPRRFRQRFYELDAHFQGPGSPVFVIVGGEGGVPPSTGLFYPFVAENLAARFGALVIEPEHRFYGESLPVPQPWGEERNRLLTPQQALADTAAFIDARRAAHNCSTRPGPTYCPVVTFGGSYPGFLSAMMRLRYPAVVEAAYAASAPVGFYAQQVATDAYYRVVTESAERAMPGCPSAVRRALAEWMAVPDVKTATEALGLCTPLPGYITDVDALKQEVNMVVMYTWAGLNMENYPPTSETGLAKACAAFVAEPTVATLASFLAGNGAAARAAVVPGAPRFPRGGGGSSDNSSSGGGCFNLTGQLPAGPNATVTSGDWSGVGTGSDGESWDFETCTFLVERIGVNNATDMFPPRAWTLEWLQQHCASRFGATPEPTALAELWGFDALERTGASKIIFTNGLNDGWSAGGIKANLSDTLVAFNMPNGAHHSDLAHSPPGPTDTPDVTETRAAAAELIDRWLKEAMQ